MTRVPGPVGPRPHGGAESPPSATSRVVELVFWEGWANMASRPGVYIVRGDGGSNPHLTTKRYTDSEER